MFSFIGCYVSEYEETVAQFSLIDADFKGCYPMQTAKRAGFTLTRQHSIALLHCFILISPRHSNLFRENSITSVA